MIQGLLIIKLSSILSFPQSSHLQDKCHVFTTKGSVFFFIHARHVLSRSNYFRVGNRADLSRKWGGGFVRTPRAPPAYGPGLGRRDISRGLYIPVKLMYFNFKGFFSITSDELALLLYTSPSVLYISTFTRLLLQYIIRVTIGQWPMYFMA